MVLHVFLKSQDMSVIVLLERLESFVMLVRCRKGYSINDLKLLILEQNLTDVSFTGKRSFLSLGSMNIEATRFNIEFQLRPLTNKGIILFVGRQISFLCLLLHSSFLELTVLAGTTIHFYKYS